MTQKPAIPQLAAIAPSSAANPEAQDYELLDTDHRNNQIWAQRMAARNQVAAIDREAAVTKPLPILRDRGNWRDHIVTRPERDALLTEKARDALQERYMSKKAGDVEFQDVFARVAWAGSDNPDHAQRLYDYISQHWFMPATPVLSNLGTTRGLPISCFLQSYGDSMKEIIGSWMETAWMSSMGGGIGSYWGRLRAVSEPVGDVGVTSGIIPFVKVCESITQAISQGAVRRGSAALYLPVWHPEITEFVQVRKPTGDLSRKALFSHNAVVIDDKFMHAVINGDTYDLVSPRTGHKAGEVDARELFTQILEIRLETGEPYILFIDNVNRNLPEHHRRLGLRVETSNLCSEITLPTGPDHHGRWRSAVCCLSSLNLRYWDDYRDNDQFFEDVYRFLDNVLDEFLLRAPETMKRAVYSAWRERSVGLGVMGFHTFLQRKGVAWSSPIARALNNNIFRTIREQAERCSQLLAEERAPCPDAAEAGVMQRFSYKIAIAPTASISTIAGGTSPGIDPITANVINHKTTDGDHVVWNPTLLEVLEKAGLDTPEIRSSILNAGGSVQHIEQLDPETREVFKTAYEIDQKSLIDLMGDRAKWIDQAASNNLFLMPNINKTELLMLHIHAWMAGVKSLYYCRSLSIQRAGNLFVEGTGDVASDNTIVPPRIIAEPSEDRFEVCESCQ